ncbi:hypothetical protein BB737_10120 [Mycobacterium avium subsp. hominissuis]|nr:hypothetical protein BB737_10120 [Mycobacterium avium subsp. hominissuis]
MVFPASPSVGPSHVQITQTDKTVVPASATQHADEEAQVIRPPLPPGPAGLSRVDTLDELAAFPDGSVIIWHCWTGWDYERQAGVLDTDSHGRTVRPISIRLYEYNTDLSEVDPPVWVVTFNDHGADGGL